MSIRTWTCMSRPRSTTSAGCWGRRRSRRTTAGYRQLLQWLSSFGEVVLVGVEGTGSYGAGLSRFLHSHRVGVVEVDRPNRQTRRLSGKSDPIDAISAARAALGGTANGAAKTRDGNVESLRVLRVAKVSAHKARTQAINQIHSLVCTAPDELRDKLRQLPTVELIRVCAGLRPPASHRRHGRHQDDAAGVGSPSAPPRRGDRRPPGADPAPGAHAPHPSCSPTTVSARTPQPRSSSRPATTPSRLRSEATFARLCGAAPIPATSGKTQHRHRLHRGGDRQANAALWRIALTRMSSDPDTRAYVARRTNEGLSKREVMRCLKRYIARELYPDLPQQMLA